MVIEATWQVGDPCIYGFKPAKIESMDGDRVTGLEIDGGLLGGYRLNVIAASPNNLRMAERIHTLYKSLEVVPLRNALNWNAISAHLGEYCGLACGTEGQQREDWYARAANFVKNIEEQAQFVAHIQADGIHIFR